MKFLYKSIAALALAASVLFGCDISDNTALPKSSFLKIYDDDSFEASFIPIDVKQTEDDGFLILGARRIEDSDFTGVYLLKADNEGNFEAEKRLSDQYIHPVKSLVEIENRFFFVAMENVSLQANLIEVSPDSLTISATPLGFSYPLYAEQADNGLVVLSYDNSNKNSVISVISTDGSGLGSEEYTIGAGSDVEAPIIEHFTRTGKQLPFFVGMVDNLFYFNGFYNYTISMVFTDLNGSGPDGVIQGQQDDGGISAALPLGSSKFALSRFNFGDNYILPSQDVSILGTSSSTDMEGNPFPELVPDAPVVIKDVEIGGEPVTLYGSDTKSGQVALLAFSKAGELLGSTYIGYSDPYEIAGFTETSDGGLVVAGTVSVAGRFNRIFLRKLSNEELSELN